MTTIAELGEAAEDVEKTQEEAKTMEQTMAQTEKEAEAANPEASTGTASKLQEGSPKRTFAQEVRLNQNVNMALKRLRRPTVRITLPDGSVFTPGSVLNVESVKEMELLIREGVDQRGFIFTTEMVKRISLEQQEAINATFGKAFKSYATGIKKFLSKTLPKPDYKKYNKTLNDFNNALKKKDKEGMLKAMKDLETQAEKWPNNVKDNFKNAAPNLTTKLLAKLPVILPAVGFIGFMTVASILIFSDTGCWAWVDGSKSSKLDIFDFNKNKEYCACSSSNPLVTPEPLDSWCPKNVPEGTPTYVTCAPWNKPVCTVDKNGKGLYYSYYQQSVSGLLNDLIKNGGKLLGGISEIPSKIAQWILVTGCIFISLYFTYEGVTNKEWIYGVGVLGAIILGILGSILI